MKYITYLVIILAAISCGNSAHKRGLKMPAQGITFEMDDKDEHKLEGYTGEMTVELGKLKDGQGAINILWNGTSCASGIISEADPFEFVCDLVGYRMMIGDIEYNLITSNRAVLKIEEFALLTEGAVIKYHQSPEFRQSVIAALDSVDAFDDTPYKRAEIALGQSFLTVQIGDSNRVSSNLKVFLDDELLLNQHTSKNRSHVFKVADVNIKLTCNRFIEGDFVHAFFDIDVIADAEFEKLIAQEEQAQRSEKLVAPATRNKKNGIPSDGTTFILNQRTSEHFFGSKNSRLDISIGDIVGRTTLVTIGDTKKELYSSYMRCGDEAIFTFENKKYRLIFVSYFWWIGGEDDASFTIIPI
jgi:hypothetical protein